MANPTCDKTNLITNAAPYMQGAGIDDKRQMVLLIYAMLLELAAIGGTDYTVAGGREQMMQDAATLEIGETNDELDAGLISIAFNRATAAGASVPATLTLKLAAVPRLPCNDDMLLKKAFILLTCKLGVHKAYPQ